MKVLDVLNYDIPNLFKDKNPKKVALKKNSSVYGVDSDVDSAMDGGPTDGGDGGSV